MQVMTITAKGCREIASPNLPRLLAARSGVTWIDMTGPTTEDVRVLEEVFHFHPLAIEDTYNQQQRPKIERYPSYLFAILNPAAFEGDSLLPRELDIFVGRNYVVTVHNGTEPIIGETRRRIESALADQVLSAGYLFYVLLDVTIDDYFPILDAITEDIETLEDMVLANPTHEALNRLFRLKRTLIDLWRVIWPQRDMLSVLAHQGKGYVDLEALQHHWRDLSDHLLWIADMVNTFRDTTTNIMDLYMSAVSNRLNRVVNRLTVFAVAIGIMTVISGFYGMNFNRTWPPFSEDWGALFVLGLMGAATLLVLGTLKWLDWY